ncbi:MAG: ATP-dependent Clp protease ATP-binding subunit [Peptoniphilaceae bacterium]|nr:ATP-dependent Clp protease ATP-binding subunit [Peptoniphilaceae bacterium]MDY3738608.1 ATP-dependent Clp protease ATP-binding subunit [Peptoniphilaceae bacterium]
MESNNRLEDFIDLARKESYELHSDHIGVSHALLALMKTGSVATKALQNSGANYELFKSILIKNVGYGSSQTMPDFSLQFKNLLEVARTIAAKYGSSYVGEEHVLLAILKDRQSFSNIMFSLSGVDKDVVKRQLLILLKEEKSSNNKNKGKNLGETLKKYTKNLNEESKSGKIDPVVGRNNEIERMMQVLMRRTKNNPVLIGEPGVGKTAIAEGLSQRIVDGEVPDIIKNKIILSLDLPQMLAGTKYRGDFEERIKRMVKELSERDDIILFIDEFHMILGAGAAEGAMDAANILKPVLARGEIQIIGATTTDEYRKHVEKDTALERRLQPIYIEEPTVEDAKKILYGLKNKYEDFHNLIIKDEAIDAAVELSDRYINDRFLPDKAIDLIDEASSKKRIENYSLKDNYKNPSEILDNLYKEKEIAVNNQDFEKAAELRDEIEKMKNKISEKPEEKEEKKVSIGFDEIAKIVSDWSKVPVTKLSEDEMQKYRDLPKALKGTVIGQDEAIDSLSHAIQRARIGLKEENKPIGSFIFVGPTGVGKTYLAKTLAKTLFGSENSLIRVDMSEYMEKFSVSRLVGSPPGYVGYEEGGQLTEEVRKHPYSVILLDEIEKAHPDVFNMLLQILDDGRLTDGQGRTVDFKNTVVIMTSNVGVSSLGSKKIIGFETEDHSKVEEENNKEIIENALKKTFRPEFLNRLDEVIMFNPIGKEETKQITKLMLDKAVDRLKNLGIKIKYNVRVVEFLAKEGFSKEYGARPLERTITKLVDDELAEKILNGDIKKDMEINLTVKQDKINFSNIKNISEEKEILKIQ